MRALCLACGVFGVIAAQLAAAAPSYRAVDLGSLNGSSFAAGNDINAQGDVVGFSDSRAFLSNGGAMTAFPSFGTPFSAAVAINDRGDIIGSFDAPDGFRSFLYANAIAVDLGHVIATDIDALGRIVGYYQDAGLNVTRAFTYFDGVAHDLGTLGGSQSVARAGNANGQVVGHSNIAGDPTVHAFLYTASSMIDLGTLPGDDISDAFGINAQGDAVGTSYSGKHPGGHAVLWRGGAIVDLGTFDGMSATAFGINATGQVVGSATRDGEETRAFIFADGRMQDLNALVLSGLSGFTLTNARAINDAGQIAANACTGPTFALSCRVFRLDPLSPGADVPVDSRLALAITAALLLASAAWRARAALR